MLKVLFFARLREQLDCAELFLDPADSQDLAQLRARLAARGSLWSEAMAEPNLIQAVNQRVVSGNQALEAGDEIAFYPPVTGG